jgi:DNA-binding CsgD family transcriptional regulator
LAAAQEHLHAGALDVARGLLVEAAAAAAGDLQRARIEQLDGQVEAAATPGREAPLRLLKAATRLEPLDVPMARDTYLQAWWAAVLAGKFAAPGGELHTVSAAALSAPPVADPRPCDLLLDGLAALITEGRTEAALTLRPAIDRFLSDQVVPTDWIEWGRSASTAAFALWDVDSWTRLSTRQVALARESGAFASLVTALNFHVVVTTCCGDFEAATSLVTELAAVKEAFGIQMAPFGAQVLAAYQGGRAAQISPPTLIAEAALIERGEGHALQIAGWANAILNNGLGRYAKAIAAAREVTYEGAFTAPLALSEVIESAVRLGSPDLADDALQRLQTLTVPGSDWAAGIEARGRALLSLGEDAERWYSRSIACLARTPLRPELGRSHLLFGEWLRSEGRRPYAREQLRAAHDIFAALSAEGFANRARAELLAAGEKVRKREIETRDALTPQEWQVARLANDGLSNPEIGARLFLSRRTVEWHLGNAFTKLGIRSRRELATALAAPQCT